MAKKLQIQTLPISILLTKETDTCGKLSGGRDPEPQIHCVGDTCHVLLNELGLDIRRGFHVASNMMPTPADLGSACLALSPTIVHTTHFTSQIFAQVAST